MPRPFATIAACVALCGFLASLTIAGCAKEDPAPTPAASAPPTPASKPPPPPEPVKLGMAEAKYVAAAILERCA